jgi:ornithine carbamoyltransferase
MAIRHLLSTTDLELEDLMHLIKRSVEFGTGRAESTRPLAGKVVGIYFRKTSTRTRTSFTVGAMKLGAQVITYGPNDLQIVTGETLEDTGRTLACYLDALVVRTNEALEEMQALARQREMAVVNALSRNEHPTQAIADLGTLLETFGRLAGIHLLYLGEGNSTASALALSVARIPEMRLTLVTPEGYGLPCEVLDRVQRYTAQSRAVVRQHHDMRDLPLNVEAVYTSRWQTMGVTRVGGENWQRSFAPYKVTAAVMAAVSRPAGTIFLHDLPAVRGEDVDDEVLDGPQSLAWRQARYKQYSGMAVLEWCLSEGRELEPRAGSGG